MSSVLQENKEGREKIAKLERDNKLLETTNEELANKITSIEDNLRSSNVLIDSLQKDLSSYQMRQKDYEKLLRKCKNATEVYKSKVKGLKLQLSSQQDTNMVPLNVHKKVLASSEYFSKLLEEKESHVQNLTDRIRNLEMILNKQLLLEKSCESNPAQKKDRKVNDVTPIPTTISKEDAGGPRHSRSELLRRMKSADQSKFASGSSRSTRLPLGARNNNIATKPLQTSNFVLSSGKENLS